jgi:hypothetical protein
MLVLQHCKSLLTAIHPSGSSGKIQLKQVVSVGSIESALLSTAMHAHHVYIQRASERERDSILHYKVTATSVCVCVLVST